MAGVSVSALAGIAGGLAAPRSGFKTRGPAPARGGL
jgi:hypothetical protein